MYVHRDGRSLSHCVYGVFIRNDGHSSPTNACLGQLYFEDEHIREIRYSFISAIRKASTFSGIRTYQYSYASVDCSFDTRPTIR